MKALVVALLVALACALAFMACERVVVLTPFPGDGGYDSGFIPDAYGGDGGQAHDGGSPFPDAAAGLD
ncbi:MAG TPA: hypothetical protein VIV58_14350 [Kofleriaceae bacterium]